MKILYRKDKMLMLTKTAAWETRVKSCWRKTKKIGRKNLRDEESMKDKSSKKLMKISLRTISKGPEVWSNAAAIQKAEKQTHKLEWLSLFIWIQTPRPKNPQQLQTGIKFKTGRKISWHKVKQTLAQWKTISSPSKNDR